MPPAGWTDLRGWCLTDDGRLQARIADPRHKLEKTYLAQVEGVISETALAALRGGVTLKDGPTLPAGARRVDTPVWLWPRVPPVRMRKTVPDGWIELTLREVPQPSGPPHVRRRRPALPAADPLAGNGDWTLDGSGLRRNPSGVTGYDRVQLHVTGRDGV